MSLWVEIDSCRERWDVRDHYVHQAWMKPGLQGDGFGVYAGQFHRAIAALAESAERLGIGDPQEPALLECAREDSVQASRWELLASRSGVDATPTPATEDCVAIWAGREAREPLEALVILYAIHSARPGVIESTAAPFVADIADGRGAHACLLAECRLGPRHAALMRRLIERAIARGPSPDEVELLSHVEAAYSAHWDLLDSLAAGQVARLEPLIAA